MSKKLWILGIALCTSNFVYCVQESGPKWGFFGHRLINKMAVFTLPKECFGFYKKHIQYMSEHAVDPDKRRYASKFEAERHYIDLDVWQKDSTLVLPADFQEALLRYSSYFLIQQNDTLAAKLVFHGDSLSFQIENHCFSGHHISSQFFLKYWKNIITPMYYEDNWLLSGQDLDDVFGTSCFEGCNTIFYIKDNFSKHGILPYFLQIMQKKLTDAFSNHDYQNILRYSAELGHYLGDAHVPLHTTENYNGQLTNQTGIHAFWESRIPELFAEEEYDFLVDTARYIPDKATFFWNIVAHSHTLVDEVLDTEKKLSTSFASDRQFCYTERANRIERLQCQEYAREWSERLHGSIELQMKSAIQALGSCIYSAWIDAGQPILPEQPFEIQDETSAIPDKGRREVRPHEDNE